MANLTVRIATLAKQLIAGMFKYPPAMQEDIHSWVMGVLLATKLALLKQQADDLSKWIADQEAAWAKRRKSKKKEEALGFVEMRKMSLEDLQREIEDVQRQRQSYAPAKVELHDSIEKVFPMDLSGWPYLPKLKDRLRGKREWKLVQDKGKLPVTIEFKRGPARANWSPIHKKITIYVAPDETRSDGYIPEVEEGIRHELRHYAQALMDDILGGQPGRAGRPPKRMRDPDIKQSLPRERPTLEGIEDMPLPEETKALLMKGMRHLKTLFDRLEKAGITPEDFHNLDDQEFYTQLGTSYELIKKRVSRLPDDQKLEEAKRLMGLHGRSGTEQFFWTLRKNKAKHRKAVNVVLKELGLL